MKTNTFSTPGYSQMRRRGLLRQFRQVGYGWVGVALLAAFVWIPNASAQTSPCSPFVLDGVTLNLCQSFMPAPFISTAAPTDAIQMATAVDRSAGYKELSITAIPFGLRSPAEDLPAAKAGGAETYRKLLSDYRTQQGGQPQPGPTTSFFGQTVPSIISAANLPVDSVTPAPVTITEWVAEAGSRLWILRIIQTQLSGVQTQGSLDVSLNSSDVNQPSTSLAAQTLPQSQSLGSQAVTVAGDLPAPSWWNGETCDYTHYTTNSANSTHRTPYPLGASYRGVLACGPRPYYDSASDVIVQFFSGAWGEYEWECVELSMRFMRLAYGIPPYSGNGKDVVWNFSGTELVKIVNGTPGEVPAPGDILSYCNGCIKVGHTSVVTASNVDANGNGSLTVMEQNNSPTGTNTLLVSGWGVGSGVTGWLHFPGNGSVSGVVKNSGGQTVAGAKVELQKWMTDLKTTTGANGAYVFNDIPAGSASVTATYSDACRTAAGATTASIVAHQNQPAPDIVMTDLTGSLNGAVKRPSGQPIPGAQVTYQKCSSVSFKTTTNNNGAYSFSNVPIGAATVTAADAPGSCSAQGQASVNVATGQNQTISDIVLNLPQLYDAAFVADVTFPDQAVFAPGQPLVKTWRLRNTGCYTWDSGYKLAFVHGDPMGGADATVPTTPMGQTADFTVNLTAPLSGSHFGYWNLRNSQGAYFGPLVFPQVNVQTPSPYLTLHADPTSPASTSGVRIYARSDSLPSFSAMRLLIDGVEVARTSATELFYTWATAGYSAIGHSLVVEAATWSDPAWSRPERRGIVYVLQGTTSAGNGPNFAPDRPALLSPPDWYSAISSTVQLCAQGADANGDALQYQYELSGTAGISTTSPVAGCYTFPWLSPGTYTWRAKAQDPAGAQSLWSASRHFSLATGSAGITQFDAVPIDPDQVRLRPCTTLTQPVTLSVRVNTAADASGSWNVIGEPAGACATDATAPVWNTLPYADGAHLLRVVALSPAGAVMSDTVFTLAPRRPAAPALLAPVASSGSFSDPVYLNSRNINFLWAAAARAQNYTLLVSTNPSPQDDPAPLVRQTVDRNSLAYSVTLDNDYPALYWQVVAANDSGSNASNIQRLSIDRTAPTCSHQSVPASATTWRISWTALDNNGISAFNLHYLDSSTGLWLKWLINVPPTVTSAVFTGLSGHTYGFWCQALDLAGNDSDRRMYLPLISR